MAESNKMVMSEPDISTLKETLCSQQQLLQQLNSDLDVEREASATAASEALSMILRLQGEKAALKMEASQYKRMAEEKICHAEEALAIFEDLIYQREMEIASLEYQVEAYRFKLVSLGCNDLDVCENRFPENLSIQKHDSQFGEKVAANNIKRLSSLPNPMAILDNNQKKLTVERKRSPTPMPASVPSSPPKDAILEVHDSEKKTLSPAAGDFNFYWAQIKKLDERVREISDTKDTCRNKSTIWRGGSWSPSLFSQVSIGSSIDPLGTANPTTSDQVKHSHNSQRKEPASTSSVQDIFEVPKVSEFPTNGSCRLDLEGENAFGKPNDIREDAPEPPKDKNDELKTMLISTKRENKLPKRPRDGKSIDHPNVPPPVHWSTMHGDSQAEYQQLAQRIERLEKAKNTVRHEISGGGEEELNVLKQICEQLKSIETEMRHWRSQKSIQNEPSLDVLRDAMLYFWC